MHHTECRKLPEYRHKKPFILQVFALQAFHADLFSCPCHYGLGSWMLTKLTKSQILVSYVSKITQKADWIDR